VPDFISPTNAIMDWNVKNIVSLTLTNSLQIACYRWTLIKYSFVKRAWVTKTKTLKMLGDYRQIEKLKLLNAPEVWSVENNLSNLVFYCSSIFRPSQWYKALCIQITSQLLWLCVCINFVYMIWSYTWSCKSLWYTSRLKFKCWLLSRVVVHPNLS